MDYAQTIWNYLKAQGFSDYGAAGIMGNLYAESALQPNNLQNSANTNLRMTDKQYTDVVDNGTYVNFVDDGAGYGLAQWTFSTLKKELYDLCKQNNTSIADVNSQLECLCNQLLRQKILELLKQSNSVREASDLFLVQFERPQDQGEGAKQKRAEYGQKYFTQFHKEGGNSMKYSVSNPPLVCMATQSACYKTNKTMTIRGVLWHSTGANNPTLKRYVQPSNDDPKRDELIALIGKNPNGNHQNRAANVSTGLNAWIGKLADGTIATVQTMPWNRPPWGCGAGGRGSCNDGWIQFEICEDDLTSKDYFEKTYKEAVEFTAYLCKLYNLNPKGTVQYAGTTVPVILCHKESANLGLGSAHADVLHWYKKYGKTMNDVRNDVANLLNGSSDEPAPTPQPTPEPTPNNYIEIGDEGPKVKKLQEDLIYLGYSCGPDGADGEFGPNTLNAVKSFQRNHNLEADGIVGTATQTALDKAVAAKKEAETPQPQPSTPEIIPGDIYRIRKSWDNPKSQIGAYRNLEYAKKVIDSVKGDYKLYNSKGQVVYPKSAIPVTPTPTPSESETVIPAKTYSDVMLGSASHDERGQYRGGNAGDSTGTEVAIQNWYRGNWDTVLRPKTARLAEDIAAADEKACGNNAIGYDQYQRNTLLAEAKKVNMDLSKITTPCECDCSSLVSTCCVCAGLPESIFFSGGNGRTTWTMQSACEQTGKFTVLKDSKYTQQKEYLKRGDILLQTDMHVVVVLQDGKYAENTTPAVTPTDNSKFPYIIRVNVGTLNVRSQPNSNAAIVTTIHKNWKYTIVAESEGWGKLKSGAGWIDLAYTVKV